MNVLHASLDTDTWTGQSSLICGSRGWLLDPKENREISLGKKGV